jgi:hypothetical protein
MKGEGIDTMGQCKYCGNTIEFSDDMRYCPYCGVPKNNDDLPGLMGISRKIEAVWGNQGVYAEKVKGICGNLAESLLERMAKNGDTPIRIDATDSITTEQLNDYFEQVYSSNNKTNLYDSFQRFMKILQDVNTDGIAISGISNADQELSLKLHDMIQTFESLTGLEVESGFGTNPDEIRTFLNVPARHEDLENYINKIHQAFEIVMTIVDNHSIFSVTNTGFEGGTFKSLKDHVSVDEIGLLQYDLKDIGGVVEKSNSYSYDDIFDDKYETHISLFWECLWLLKEHFQKQVDSDYKPTTSASMSKELNLWREKYCVLVDHKKYDAEFKMTELYMKAFEAYVLLHEKIEAEIMTLGGLDGDF